VATARTVVLGVGGELGELVECLLCSDEVAASKAARRRASRAGAGDPDRTAGCSRGTIGALRRA
jgi:hypothetical protein